MQQIFLTYLQNEIILSIIIIMLLILSMCLFKTYSSKSKYYMWLVILIALIIPYRPVINETIWRIDLPFYTEKPSINEISDIVEQQINDLSITQNNTFDKTQSITQSNLQNSLIKKFRFSNITWLDYTVYAWLIGCLTYLLMMLISHFQFIRYSKKWYEPIEQVRLQNMIEKLKKEYQIEVEVKRCKLLNTPLTIGLFDMIILIPCIEFTEEELELLLRHEMVHCKQRDIWYKLLINLAVAIHWYNPIIYLMKNRIYLECEAACDEQVLQGKDPDTRLQYGEMIIEFIQHRNIKGRSHLIFHVI